MGEEKETQKLDAEITAKYGPAVVEAKELAEALRWIAQQLDALRWIAQQPCQYEAEGSSESEGIVCSETSACITEWCLPCYAKASLADKKEK